VNQEENNEKTSRKPGNWRDVAAKLMGESICTRRSRKKKNKMATLPLLWTCQDGHWGIATMKREEVSLPKATEMG
jgi:hypothetical protein